MITGFRWLSILNQLHLGIGYLIAFYLLVMLGWSLYEIVSRSDSGQNLDYAMVGLIGLVDLQVLLGLLQYLLYPVQARPSIEHPAIMVTVAIGLHLANKLGRTGRLVLLIAGALFVGRGIMVVV